jgi:hypothetical protein
VLSSSRPRLTQGYPTLKFWRDGHIRSYRHPRTQEGLIEFGALVTAPAVTPVANAAGSNFRRPIF